MCCNVNETLPSFTGIQRDLMATPCWVQMGETKVRMKHRNKKKGQDLIHSSNLQDTDPMWFPRWTSVADGGPTLGQHLVNVLYLLGCLAKFNPSPTRYSLGIVLNPLPSCDTYVSLQKNEYNYYTRLFYLIE